MVTCLLSTQEPSPQVRWYWAQGLAWQSCSSLLSSQSNLPSHSWLLCTQSLRSRHCTWPAGQTRPLVLLPDTTTSSGERLVLSWQWETLSHLRLIQAPSVLTVATVVTLPTRAAHPAPATVAVSPSLEPPPPHPGAPAFSLAPPLRWLHCDGRFVCLEINLYE